MNVLVRREIRGLGCWAEFETICTHPAQIPSDFPSLLARSWNALTCVQMASRCTFTCTSMKSLINLEDRVDLYCMNRSSVVNRRSSCEIRDMESIVCIALGGTRQPPWAKLKAVTNPVRRDPATKAWSRYSRTPIASLEDSQGLGFAQWGQPLAQRVRTCKALLGLISFRAATGLRGFATAQRSASL